MKTLINYFKQRKEHKERKLRTWCLMKARGYAPTNKILEGSNGATKGNILVKEAAEYYNWIVFGTIR